MLLMSANVAAQTYNLKGMVMDGQGKPMKYATVSLLHPGDSTLAFFGISNASGVVEVKNAAGGKYLLQCAMMGYRTYYKPVEVPISNGDMGIIVLDQLDVQQMKEVVVTGERIPVSIKGDTVEYNATSFKTKPDANLEELLKKLPGVEVDKAGNIKAQGEAVNKVMVDGKEFFGDDPKVATRNLPADAINKVQVFDKKSDMTEFTGIDDGSRERTINFMLKDGKKQGYFGDVTAGGGTDERYKGSAKLYRFRPKSQFAALGMINNINRSGFSFSDYMNFSGGLQSLMSGGGALEMNGDDMPVDFGQQVNGIVTSAAAGLNYSYELAKNRRITLSYLGNGANKKLEETTWSRNFVQDREYTTDGSSRQVTDNIVHRLNMNIRNDVDSFTQVTFAGGGELTNNQRSDKGSSSSHIADVMINTQSRNQQQVANTIGGKATASYTRRSRTGKDVLSLAGNGNYKRSLKEDEWGNVTTFTGQPQPVSNNMFLDDRLNNYIYGGQVAWSHALGKGYFIEPKVAAGNSTAELERRQGIMQPADVIVDSLSPDFTTSYTHVRPGVTFKKSSKKTQYNIGLSYEQGMLAQRYGTGELPTRNSGYVLPNAMWRREFARGRHLNFNYSSSVNAPEYTDLLSTPVISGPLSVSVGNSGLRPEYAHRASAGWMLYDQFTMTSFFVNVNGTYTHDKINRSVVVDNNNLAQYNTLVNVPDDYRAALSLQFDKPIGKLGIKVNSALNESYQKGITLVNGVQNITTSLAHEFKLGIENNKKDKWDAAIGGSIRITDARYSVQQSMNNVFYNTGGYAELSYRPTDHWYFLLSADVVRYDQQSFEDAVLVPLVRSEISYYFLQGNRGVLTLEGFDLLNGNKGLQRISQQNYLAEIRSNTIGQYFMLSFKYRLNKTGKKSANMLDDIEIRTR